MSSLSRITHSLTADYLSSEKFMSCVLAWLQQSAGRDTNLHEYYCVSDKAKHRELLDDLMMYLLRRAGFVSPAQLENILDRMKADYERGKSERIPAGVFKEFCGFMKGENLDSGIPEKRPNSSDQSEVIVKAESTSSTSPNSGKQSPAYRNNKRHRRDIDQTDVQGYEVHGIFQTDRKEKKLSALELDLKERELDLKERELKIQTLETQTAEKISKIELKLKETELRIAETNANIREHLYSQLKSKPARELNLSCSL